LIALQKIHELQPQILVTYKTYLQEALFDEEPPVVFIAITLMKRLIAEDPEPYKDMTDDFCRILKDIVLHKYPKEYDYHKVPAPWLQIDLLRVLAMLGRNDSKTSSKIYDVVEKTLRKSTYYRTCCP
jgi:AP-4 complex subunit epsilon-1